MHGNFLKTIVAPTLEGALIAGWSDPVKIPLAYAVEGLSLMLHVNGTSDDPVPDPEAPASLIDDIAVSVDGPTPIHADGEMLAAAHKLYRNVDPEVSMNDTTLTPTAELGHEEIEVPFISLGLYPARASMLVPKVGKKEIKDASLKIHFADPAVLGSGYTPDGATVDVYVKQNLHDQIDFYPAEKLISMSQKLISGSDDKFVIPLPQNRFIHYALIKTEIDGIADDTILNKLSVRINDKMAICANIKYDAIRAHMKKMLRLQVVPSGYVLIDFADFSGSWAKLFDGYRYPEAFLELDVNGPEDGHVNRVKVMTAAVATLPVVR